MNAQHTTIRSLAGNPGLEALELRDFNAADLTPTQDPDAFPADEMTDAEVDAMWVAEMERRDREAAAVFGAPAGYRDAACVACNVAVFVPKSAQGDTLCPACEREGNAIAADDDSDPTRPGGAAALPPEFAHFAEYVKRWPDDQLVGGIALADRGALAFTGDKAAANVAWLSAATAEVLRRLAA